MPYFVHRKDRPLPETLHHLAFASPLAYTSRADAFTRVKAIGGQATHTISFVASDREISEWRHRERRRFREGEYVRVPWSDREPYDYQDHYAHLSIDKPGMVAYTPDVEHGITDKQTRLTPGRYLERFYADRFTREQIAEYVASVSANFSSFQLARSVDDVRTVYRGGPSSCMGGPESHTNQYWNEDDLDGHMPCEVYASPSDLAVAYFGPIDHASQRCVVWPDKKRYYRVYGTGPLATLLEKDGYRHSDNPLGARVLNIRIGSGHLMPYVDGIGYGTVESNRFIVLDDEGPIDCQTTAGVYPPQGRNDEDEEDDYISCARCGDVTLPDDLDEDLCPACYAERWGCDGCGHVYYSDETQTTIGQGDYCESCTENRSNHCQDGDCDHTWIEENAFSPEEIAERKRHDLADLCPECAAHYAWCEHCETSHDTRVHDSLACPDCGRYPRCEQTADLFSQLTYDAEQSEIAILTAEIAILTADRYYRLEIHKDGAWRPCYWNFASNDDIAIGSFDRVSAHRDHLQAMYPNYSYRLVTVYDHPIMPFPHGLTSEQIVSAANV